MNKVEKIPAGYKQTEIGVIPADWELVSYDKAFNFLRTAAYSRSQLGTDGKVRYIHYGDIHKKWHNFVDLDQNLPTVDDSKVCNFSLIENGDVVIADASEDYEGIGKSVEVINKNNIPAISGLHTFLMRDKNNFFALGFRGYIHANRLVKSSMDKLATGLKVYGVSKANLKLIQIPRPTLPEQIVIATVLSDTDALIELLGKMIAKRNAIKQGTMQQLLTGKKRLPGFNGEWKVKKLGEVGNCIRGVSYNGERDLSSYDTNTTVRLLRSNNIQNGTIDLSELQFVNISRVKLIQALQKNDIVICMANGSKQLVGKSAIFDISNNYNYTFGAFMGCFRTNPNQAVSKFISFIFQTYQYRSYIDVLLSGSSINNLKPSDIESIEILYPKQEEQTAIATILSDMDAEIESLEQKRDKHTMLKQGMMQQLLTGKIRLGKN